MNGAALHPTPHWPAIVPAELRAVGIGMRRELMGIGALLLVLSAVILVSRLRGVLRTVMHVSPDDTGLVLAVIALLAPLAVWKAEGPSSRGYFWSLPLPRDRHTLIKVLGGWIWLMVTIAGLMAWLGIQAWISGGGLGIEQTRLVLAEGAVPPGTAPHEIAKALGGVVDPALLREIRWRTPAWLWLVPFAAPTVAYLAGTIAAVRSDHPWRWLAAPFIAFALIRLLAEAARLGGLSDVGEQILVGPYGLETLLSGSNESAWLLKTTTGEEVRVWRDLAEPGRWFTTLILWGAPALAGVLLAAHRHQER